MTRKRYMKLTRALMTYLHEYSKAREGEIMYNGEPMKRTPMKRENMAVHPNWEVIHSYEEGWQMLQPVWDSVQGNLRKIREERGER